MGLALEITDLRWSFPGTKEPFLNLEHLWVPAGGFLAVTGPSGAGKSTLLYLLAGLETADRGLLRWGDLDLSMTSPAGRDGWRRRHLGLVFQDFQLVPELTALENVLLPLTFFQWTIPPAERRRARDLLARLGVLREQAPASTLSRGEMQRTALARALLGRPEVLLADEPTASLDGANEDAVAELLVEYGRQQGATIVLSTHHLNLRDRAQRVLVLDHGRPTEAAQ